MRTLDGSGGSIAQLEPDSDPAAIAPYLQQHPAVRSVQFAEALPAPVLAAAAEALKRHPDVGLRAYGDYGGTIEPGLAWLHGFEHIRHLRIDLWREESFERLADFTELRSIGIGETKSTRPSLSALRNMQNLEEAWIEGHARDFDVLGELRKLRALTLRAPKAKSLAPLTGHSAIELFSMQFGGIRDLSPLASLSRLRGLALWQIRSLDTDAVANLGDCAGVEALSLGALRRVESLAPLAAGMRKLRYLLLEKLPSLDTLAPFGELAHLEEVGLYEARPADANLLWLLDAPRLRGAIVSDKYSRDQVDRFCREFQGTAFVSGREVGGNWAKLRVRWRSRPEKMLADGRFT